MLFCVRIAFLNFSFIITYILLSSLTWLSSISILPNATAGYVSANDEYIGAIILHGGHQVAVKYKTDLGLFTRNVVTASELLRIFTEEDIHLFDVFKDNRRHRSWFAAAFMINCRSLFTTRRSDDNRGRSWLAVAFMINIFYLLYLVCMLECFRLLVWLCT